MPGKFVEDFVVGEVSVSPSRTVTETAAAVGVSRQPLHAWLGIPSARSAGSPSSPHQS